MGPLPIASPHPYGGGVRRGNLAGKNTKIIRIFANPLPNLNFIPMLQLVSRIPDNNKIKNIIFDFGGVICDLDIKRTEKKFREFGQAAYEGKFTPEEQSREFASLVESYEKGHITSQEFRDTIKNHYLKTLTDQDVDDTWNALLLGIPEKRIRLLEEIRSVYRIFLLSNSNEIHYLHYVEMFRQISGYNDFNDLFEKSYFSYQLHLSKPGREIFEFVLRDSHLRAEETLFIDDTLKHVEMARRLSLHAYHLQIQQRESITDLFESAHE